MAKKAILDVLESTIGKYVHNLDAQSLNVAVWSGKIQLSKLELNTEAVNRKLAQQATDAPALAVPLRVVGGHFDAFQVDVPWAKLTSKPVVLRANGLTVVVEPYDHLAVEAIAPSISTCNSPSLSSGVTNTPGKSSSSKLGASIKYKSAAVTATKSRREQSMEEADEARVKYNAIRNLTTDDNESVSSVSTGGMDPGSNDNNFLARLVRRIAENLQVEINNVRIEMRACGCSAGVVLKSLSLVSTNENGERAFIDRGSSKNSLSFLHKELNISGLGIYCDEDNGLKGDSSSAHSYILAPLSFQAKLRQADTMECVDFAKYLVTSEIANCSILIARRQLELLHNVYTTILIRQHRSGASRPLFPEYRPLLPILDRRASRSHSKLWWRYALRCMGRLTRRTSWMEFYKAFQKRKTYILLYKRQLHTQQGGTSWNKSLSREEKSNMFEIERDRSITVEGIMLWRNMADAQFEMERNKHRQQQELKKSSLASKTVGGRTPINSGSIRDSSPYKRNSSLIRNLFGNKEGKKESNSGFHGSDGSIASLPSMHEDGTSSFTSDAPIQLTAQELRELEALHMEHTSELMLSKDSKLYDLQFRLGSFKMDFITHSQQPLAKLQMGTVSTSFTSNADGSFSLLYSMTNLQVDDRLTYNSLFRSVVRTILIADDAATNGFDHGTTNNRAFLLKLEQQKNGDSNIVVRGAAVEIVASPVLLAGVKDFITIVPADSDEDGQENWSASASTSIFQSVYNPLMRESTSGSVDLFFDANQGKNSQLFDPRNSMPSPSFTASESFMFVDETTASAAKDAASRVSDKLSQTLADAWSVKNKSDRRWLIDVDIHAPIFVLPENCTDPNAVVLVLNFGQFTMKPQLTATQSMLQWFESSTEDGQVSKIESWKLETKELSFLVGTAGQQDWGPNGKEESCSLAIIEPLSMELDLGTEIRDTSSPRTFADGVIPIISFQISPKQIQQVLSVSSAWLKAAEQIRGSAGESVAVGASEGMNIILEGSDAESDTSDLVNTSLTPRHSSRSPKTAEEQPMHAECDTASNLLFARFALRRLSMSFLAGDEEQTFSKGVEAHLVSAVLTHLKTSDGASHNRATMGWFWILDRLPASYPRTQRLLAHSKLPLAAAYFAEEDKYEIVETLENQGVFESSYEGSSDLADITIAVPSDPSHGEKTAQITVYAAFSSLIINWNPYAIRALLVMHENLVEPALKNINESTAVLSRISSPGRQAPQKRASLLRQESGSEVLTVLTDREVPREIAVNAKMENFTINFHSAKDDLPLFFVTMSRANVDVLLFEDGDSLTASLELGDFRTETAISSRTLERYKTILGLAPNQASSLLQVQYYKGYAPIIASGMAGVDPSRHEACAELDLSPMIYVHIQAQVLTLLDYVQEGILAPLGPKSPAPSHLSQDKVEPGMGEKVFDVRARGFECILPQAAYAEEHFKARVGLLQARYCAAANMGGGDVKLTLSQMFVECNRGISMVKEPIEMSVEAWIGPNHASNVEDRVVRAKVGFTEVFLLVSRNHVEQLFYVMKRNIQEEATFFREGTLPLGHNGGFSPGGDASTFDTTKLTHAGTQVLIIKKRIFADITAGVVSIAYCRSSSEAPFMELSAVRTELNVALVPDMEKLSASLTFQNVYVEDCRREANHNTFRRLFSQFSVEKKENSQLDVFNLNFDRNEETGSTDIEVKVGAPQVVILPDLLYEVAELAKIPELLEESMGRVAHASFDSQSAVSIDARSSTDAIETSVTDTTAPPACVSTKISIKTSTCRIVALDVSNICQGTKINAMDRNQAAQLFVLQGQIEASIRSTKESSTGIQLSNETQINGDFFEIYAAHGEELGCPVQIMDPARFSLFVTKATSITESSENLVVKAVALTPLDISFSLQNAALVRAIALSIQESLETLNDGGANIDITMLNRSNGDRLTPLTEKEASRIEDLSFALEHENQNAMSSFAKASFSETSSQPSVMTAASRGRTSMGNIGPLNKYFDVHLTMPDAAITIVNDFGGLDNPLFKIRTRNVVGKGQVDLPVSLIVRRGFKVDRTSFRLRLNSSILANYFDSSSNLWEPLLLKPWETTITFQRSDKRRFKQKIERMSTDLDVESQRCLVSFSEQFLVSIGAASRMWSLYADSSSGRRIVPANPSAPLQPTKAIAMPTPYGIDNQIGLPVEYVIQPKLGGSNNPKHVCPSGVVCRFGFRYPCGAGVGGKRAYGQDSIEFKELLVFVGEKCIRVKDFDAELNGAGHAHDCGGGILIFSSVVKISRVMVRRLVF
jgi:hypothetical protein